MCPESPEKVGSGLWLFLFGEFHKSRVMRPCEFHNKGFKEAKTNNQLWFTFFRHEKHLVEKESIFLLSIFILAHYSSCSLLVFCFHQIFHCIGKLDLITPWKHWYWHPGSEVHLCSDILCSWLSTFSEGGGRPPNFAFYTSVGNHVTLARLKRADLLYIF